MKRRNERGNSYVDDNGQSWYNTRVETENQMAQITLTRGLFATVDDDDLEQLSKFKWMANFSRRKFYATRGDNKIMMHHVVINYVRQKGLEIDHINGDSL